MKIIVMVTAAFFAMLSVAAATDLPIGKYPAGADAHGLHLLDMAPGGVENGAEDE
jgi:hypothetical protein